MYLFRSFAVRFIVLSLLAGIAVYCEQQDSLTLAQPSNNTRTRQTPIMTTPVRIQAAPILTQPAAAPTPSPASRGQNTNQTTTQAPIQTQTVQIQTAPAPAPAAGRTVNSRNTSSQDSTPVLNKFFKIQNNTPTGDPGRMATPPANTRDSNGRPSYTPPVTRNVAPAVDLSIIGAPTVQGTSVIVVVQNLGTATSPETEVTLFLADINGRSAGKSRGRVVSLQPQHRQSVILNAPAGITSLGGMKFQVMVDVDNTIAESNETNNRSLTTDIPGNAAPPPGNTPITINGQPPTIKTKGVSKTWQLPDSVTAPVKTAPANKPNNMAALTAQAGTINPNNIQPISKWKNLPKPKLHAMGDIQQMAIELQKFNNASCTYESFRMSPNQYIKNTFPDPGPEADPEIQKKLRVMNSLPLEMEFMIHTNCAGNKVPTLFVSQVATAPVETSSKPWHSQLTVIEQRLLNFTPQGIKSLADAKVASSANGTFYYPKLKLLSHLEDNQGKLEQWVFDHWEHSWALGDNKNIFQQLYVRFVPVVPANGGGDGGFTGYEPAGKGTEWMSLHVYPSELSYKEYAKNKATKDYYEEKIKQSIALEDTFNKLREQAKSAYTIEFLSYIPPKFTDDPGAEDYLVMNHSRTLHFGGNQYYDEQDVTWFKGQSFSAHTANYILDSNATVFEELYNLATGVLNGVSGAYAKAKDAVVAGIAAGITKTGIIDCDAPCKSALMTGLNFALAYAGIPPTLPTSSTLFSQGTSYLATSLTGVAIDNIASSELATYVDASMTELGKEIAGDSALGQMGQEYLMEEAKRRGKEKAKEAMYQNVRQEMVKFTQGALKKTDIQDENPYTWGTPDPAFRKHPPIVYLRITPNADSKVLQNVAMTGLQLQFPKGDYFSSEPKTITISHVPKKGMVIPMLMSPRAVQWPYLYSSACGDNSVPCTLDGTLGRFAPGFGQPVYNLPSVHEPMVLTTFHELRHPKYLGKMEPIMIERLHTEVYPGFINTGKGDGVFPIKDFYGEILLDNVESLH